ncbi:MAG: hypothetical protein ACUVTL_09605 [Thermoproteota archaeon]
MRNENDAPLSNLSHGSELATTITKSTLGAKEGSCSTRKLSKAKAYLSEFVDSLGLSKRLLERSFQIYSEACKSNLFSRRLVKDTVAAVIYYACRENKLPITVKEVSMKTGVERRKINRGYNVLVNFLGKEIPSPDISKLIESITNLLNLDSHVVKDCHKIMNKLNLNASEILENPSGLAGAIVFVSCQNYGMTWITREEVAKVAKVSVGAIGKRVKQVKQALGKILYSAMTSETSDRPLSESYMQGSGGS